MNITGKNRIQLVLIAAMIAIAGCDPQTSPAAAPTSAAAPATAPTTDAASAKACKDLQKDIKDNAALVAKAKKIGPPAGHIAVSAQWIAGSATITKHSAGANEKVAAAAGKVQQEMSDLSDEYNKSDDAKPSTAKLDAAIKELTAACAAPA